MSDDASDLPNLLRSLNIRVRTDVLLYCRDDPEIIQDIFQIDIRPTEDAAQMSGRPGAEGLGAQAHPLRYELHGQIEQDDAWTAAQLPEDLSVQVEALMDREEVRLVFNRGFCQICIRHLVTRRLLTGENCLSPTTLLGILQQEYNCSR